MIAKNDSWVSDLKTYAPWKKYSQYGEEAYLDYILKSIEVSKNFFVDLGAWDGFHLSNTQFFKEQGWDGLMVDADNHGNDEVKKEIITLENILDIFERHSVPKEFGLLSIDLDGNDWWILDKILSEYRPDVVIAEFNGTIPVGMDMVIKYNPDHYWKNNDYYGASFEAFKRLARSRGYTVVFQNDNLNIYLVNDSKMEYPQKDWNISYTAIQYHPHFQNGDWITL